MHATATENGSRAGVGDATPAKRVDIAIIGSGFSGLGAGYRLKQAGFDDFVILERGEDVGGTWWWNSYPGCQCDIPSHLYSFSFAPNPDWSQTYPLQAELYGYLRDCAERFELMSHIRFGHNLERAVWSDEDALWRLETSAGVITARVLIGGQGPLSEPLIPRIPGRESFAGPAFHSARWDHSVDLSGKKVAVVGTGASSIQIVPNVQGKVAQLHVFQRTPPWVLPHPGRAITRLERWLYRRVPALQHQVRRNTYWWFEVRALPMTRRPEALRLLEPLAIRHMKKEIQDPELQRRLTPNYRLGCKRLLPSNEWYRALAQPNVNVVTEAVREICPNGVVAADGSVHECDVIIWATGFHVTDIPLANHVVGAQGKTLADFWAGSPRAYKGATVPGFPNLFQLSGPNTGTGHNSVIFVVEAQLDYLIDALVTMRARGIRAVDALPEAYRFWNRAVERRMPPTVWSTGGCSSWYFNENGTNTALWPDFTWKFRRLTRRFDLGAYRALGDGPEGAGRTRALDADAAS